jgi:hypothetical protein
VYGLADVVRTLGSVTRASAVVVGVAVVACAVTGCGGGGSSRLSKGAYEAKLSSLSQGLAASVRNVAAFDPTDLAAAPAFLDHAAATLDGVARSLDGVRPPQDAEVLNARLVEGSSTAAKELRSLGAELEGATPADAQKLLAQFDPSRLSGLQELEQAAAGLVAKGYRFSASRS